MRGNFHLADTEICNRLSQVLVETFFFWRGSRGEFWKINFKFGKKKKKKKKKKKN
jgi:hypothetical protein